LSFNTLSFPPVGKVRRMTASASIETEVQRLANPLARGLGGCESRKGLAVQGGHSCRVQGAVARRQIRGGRERIGVRVTARR
jgi:hypothetical protein